MSAETIRTIRDGEPRSATSTFTQLLGSVSLFRVQVQCCFMSTETERTIRDGEPRTATSTFTQLLRSEERTALFILFKSFLEPKTWPHQPQSKAATSKTQNTFTPCKCSVKICSVRRMHATNPRSTQTNRSGNLGAFVQQPKSKM